MIQTGHNSSSHNFLVVSNVEFYGELYENFDIYKDEDEDDTLTIEHSVDSEEDSLESPEVLKNSFSSRKNSFLFFVNNENNVSLNNSGYLSPKASRNRIGNDSSVNEKELEEKNEETIEKNLISTTNNKASSEIENNSEFIKKNISSKDPLGSSFSFTSSPQLKQSHTPTIVLNHNNPSSSPPPPLNPNNSSSNSNNSSNNINLSSFLNLSSSNSGSLSSSPTSSSSSHKSTHKRRSSRVESPREGERNLSPTPSIENLKNFNEMEKEKDLKKNYFEILNEDIESNNNLEKNTPLSKITIIFSDKTQSILFVKEKLTFSFLLEKLCKKRCLNSSNHIFLNKNKIPVDLNSIVPLSQLKKSDVYYLVELK